MFAKFKYSGGNLSIHSEFSFIIILDRRLPEFVNNHERPASQPVSASIPSKFWQAMEIIIFSLNIGIHDHLVLKYILHKCCRLPFDIH
jgi:hypothetical protein